MTHGERTVHGGSAVQRKIHNWTFVPFLQFFGGGIYAPDPSTYDPIEILLNTVDEEERDELTARWRDNKLSELNFVGVVSALLAGVLTSTGSWPAILPSGELSPWPIRTSWYSGIILSLFSLLTAADQTVRLHRLSSHRDGLANLRRLLAKRPSGLDPDLDVETGGARLQPSLLQIVTWQMSVMFLTCATLCMVVGLFLHIWSATPHVGRHGPWDDDSKVAVTYTVVAGAAVVLFCVGQVALYSPIRK